VKQANLIVSLVRIFIIAIPVIVILVCIRSKSSMKSSFGKLFFALSKANKHAS
jgi:hypothetical protein